MIIQVFQVLREWHSAWESVEAENENFGDESKRCHYDVTTWVALLKYSHYDVATSTTLMS